MKWVLIIVATFGWGGVDIEIIHFDNEISCLNVMTELLDEAQRGPSKGYYGRNRHIKVRCVEVPKGGSDNG